MKVDTKQFEQLIKELEQLAPATMKEAGAYFKSITPIDTGNARRKTSTRKQTISADYGYAGKLDEGYSRQAPQGMSDPTIDQIEKIINSKVGRL